MARLIEDADVRPAKSVDALARVADDEEAARFARIGQRADDLPLQRAGIVEFIDQHLAKLATKAIAHCRLFEDVAGQPLQICIVEQIGISLARAEGILYQFDEPLPMRQQLCRAMVKVRDTIACRLQRDLELLSQDT